MLKNLNHIWLLIHKNLIYSRFACREFLELSKELFGHPQDFFALLVTHGNKKKTCVLKIEQSMIFSEKEVIVYFSDP